MFFKSLVRPACGLVLLCALTAHASDRVALVIGNSSYPNSPLHNPENDARDMTGLLKKAGFTVLGKTNATKADLEKQVAEFGKQITDPKVKIAVFYYAGHGVQLDWRNYLVPIDAAPRTAQELRDQSLDVSALLGYMQRAQQKGRSFLIVLDACRDDPFAGTYQPPAKGLSQFDAPVGSLLAYSTSPGKVALDGVVGGSNGLYTAYLLQELNKRGTPIEDAFKRTRLNVRLASNGQQVPWETTSLEDDVYLFPGEVKKLSDREQVAEMDVELKAWSAVKNASSPYEIANFLRQHPSGNFSELATNRMNRLLASQSNAEMGRLIAKNLAIEQVKQAQDAQKEAQRKADAERLAREAAVRVAAQLAAELAERNAVAAREAERIRQAQIAVQLAAQRAADEAKAQELARAETAREEAARAGAASVALALAQAAKREAERQVAVQAAAQLEAARLAAVAALALQATAQQEAAKQQAARQELVRAEAARADAARAEALRVAEAKRKADEAEAARLANEQAKIAKAEADRQAQLAAERQRQDFAKAEAARAEVARLEVLRVAAVAAELANARVAEQAARLAAEKQQSERLSALALANAVKLAEQRLLAADVATVVAAPVSFAATQFYRGSNDLQRSFHAGDRHEFRVIDAFNKSEKPLVMQVSKVEPDSDRVEFNNGDYVTDLMGNVLTNLRGASGTPRQFYPAELTVGKRWRTLFRQTRPNGTVYVFRYDMRVVGRETITVPAGTFNTFKIEGRGFNMNLGAALERNIWVAPGVSADIALETNVRLANGMWDQRERQELVSYQTKVAAPSTAIAPSASK